MIPARHQQQQGNSRAAVDRTAKLRTPTPESALRMSKLLLIGNHTCGNRGDGAILRGLVTALAASGPHQLTITSRYPVSSSHLLGREVIADPYAHWTKSFVNGRLRVFKSQFAYRLLPLLLLLAVRWNKPGWLSYLPPSLKHELALLKEQDVVIQVGGSFFVDLYGVHQYALTFAAILLGKPVVLLGHSMGPFRGTIYRWFARTLLEHAKQVALREQVSRELIVQSGLPTAKLSDGGDTAWLVTPTTASTTQPWKPGADVSRPLVAITVRELAPFDRRLGVSQQDYEGAIAKLVDHLVEQGFDVIAASTCTGIDSYHRDDRMNALQVGARVKHKDHYHVVMDELNDIELGQLFASCELVVGTRLHSTIISMNFGTPAVAINYEHKSQGIMRQLGLPALSASINELLDGSLTERLDSLLVDLPALRQAVQQAVAGERARTSAMVATALKDAGIQA